MSPAYENETVIAETKVIKKGKQLINAQCNIWNSDRSKLIAQGSSNLIRTTIPK
jgi:acyl-coenzyme A thioesterase 13